VEAAVSIEKRGVNLASVHHVLEQGLDETIQVGTLLHYPRGSAETLV